MRYNNKWLPSLLLCVLFCCTAAAAAPADSTGNGKTADTSAKSLVRGADDLKGGNTLDVLTDFFQLAAQDLASSSKSFNFKSTLFALKLKADSSLNIDTLFRKQRLSRNLQFDIAVNVDQDFHLTGFTAGVTYAFINNRDKAMANFRSQAIARNDETLLNVLDSLTNVYSRQNILTLQNVHARDSLLGMMAKGAAVLRASSNHTIDSFPKGFQAVLRPYKLDSLSKMIQTEYDSLMDDVGQRGLLTGSVYGSSNNLNQLKSGYAEVIYLKGKNVQADIRGKLAYTDTVMPNTNYRLNCDVSGGADIEIVHSKTDPHKSVMEIKPALEYQKVFNGAYPGEKDEMFTFNAEVRLRITNNLWIPLTVKYDVRNQNFLGFLNVSFNTGMFKKSLASK